MSQGQILGALPQLMGKKSAAELDFTVKKENMRRQNVMALQGAEQGLVNMDQQIFAQRRADAEKTKLAAGETLASGMQNMADKALYEKYKGPGSPAHAMQKLLNTQLMESINQNRQGAANTAASMTMQAGHIGNVRARQDNIGNLTPEQLEEISGMTSTQFDDWIKQGF
jgi:hypothetical protein